MGLSKTLTKGASPGLIRAHHDTALPAGWLWCDGTNTYPRADYLSLFEALTDTYTVNTTNTSPFVTITGGGPVRAGNWAARVEIEGAVVGAMMTAGQGTSNIVLDSSATATLTGATMRVLPFGASGTTTFGVPDLTGRVPKHLSYLGYKAGNASVYLTSSHMPSHSHATSDPTHGHAISDGDSHTHGGSYAERYGVLSTVGTGTARTFAYGVSGSNNVVSVTFNVSAPTGGGFPANTSTTGTDTTHSNMQPTLPAKYMVRYLP